MRFHNRFYIIVFNKTYMIPQILEDGESIARTNRRYKKPKIDADVLFSLNLSIL